MKNKKIRIGILDNDIKFVENLVRLQELYSDLIFYSLSLEDLFGEELLEGKLADVILIDLEVIRKNGEQCISELKEQGIKYIILSSKFDESIVLWSFSIGAENFIPKKYYTQLPDSIRMVNHSYNPIGILVKYYCQAKINEKFQLLSKSEQVVLELLGKGLSRVEIENHLYKSSNTIRNQINSILKKLNVSNSKEAIKLMKI